MTKHCTIYFLPTLTGRKHIPLKMCNLKIKPKSKPFPSQPTKIKIVVPWYQNIWPSQWAPRFSNKELLRIRLLNRYKLEYLQV